MSASAGNIIIGGGKGFIGTALKKFLQQKGFTVSIISRMPREDQLTWDDMRVVGIPPNTRAVINVAGENVLNPLKRWNEDFIEEVTNSRVETTKLLADAIQYSSVKPNIFISMSGVGIYKPDANTVYDEYTKLDEGFDFISRLAHKWEDAAKIQTPNVRQVVIRSGVVLGKTGGMIKQIYWPFFFGLGGPISNGSQYFPWIHSEDLCRLMFFAITNDEVNGVLNGVAPQIITNKEFTKAFAKSLVRPAIFPLPAFMVKLLFGSERSIMMLDGQKVTPKRVNEYGFEYLYPNISEACRELCS